MAQCVIAWLNAVLAWVVEHLRLPSRLAIRSIHPYPRTMTRDSTGTEIPNHAELTFRRRVQSLSEADMFLVPTPRRRGTAPLPARPSRVRLSTVAMLIGGFSVSAAGGTSPDPGKRSSAGGPAASTAGLGSD